MRAAIKAKPEPFSPDDGLRGKAVLVTGGTTGIGRAIAAATAREGARVLIFGRTQSKLKAALEAIEGEVYGIIADQSEKAGIAKVFKAVDAKLGGLDILINNASVDAGSVIETSYDEIAKAVSANLTGYLACCHEAIARMKKAGAGDIVNIGSMSAVDIEAGGDIYTAVKSGVQGFTDSLRKSLVKDNIRVVLVEPGLVGTDMTASGHPLEEQIRMQAEGMMLTAEDVADCIRYILTRPRRCDITSVRIQPHGNLD